jgi:hypothetical protein
VLALTKMNREEDAVRYFEQLVDFQSRKSLFKDTVILNDIFNDENYY